eukprot:403371009
MGEAYFFLREELWDSSSSSVKIWEFDKDYAHNSILAFKSKKNSQNSSSQEDESSNNKQNIKQTKTIQKRQNQDQQNSNIQKEFKSQKNQRLNGTIASIKQSKKVYDKRSLYIFSLKNPLRRLVLKILEHKAFEYFILSLILINSLALAMFDYSDRDSITQYNNILEQLGVVLTYLFTAECVLKIIGLGFFVGKNSYLRDGWNVVDFAVVITGLVEISGGSIKLKSLRVLRVLRPLRSINAIPSMKKLVGALIQSLPDFFNVAIFLAFIFLLFAILGVHQYNGVLYNRCRYQNHPESPNEWKQVESLTRVCTQSGSGNFACPSEYYCGNPQDFNIDLMYENLDKNVNNNYGITTFDNLGSSLLTVFQIVTTDGWTPIMLNLMDSEIPFLAALYCILLVIVASFFLMNLILAVIIQAFIKIQRAELEQEILSYLEIEPDKEQIEEDVSNDVEDLSKSSKSKYIDLQNDHPLQIIPTATPQPIQEEKRKSNKNLNFNIAPLENDSQSSALLLNESNLDQDKSPIQERSADFSFLKKKNMQKTIKIEEGEEEQKNTIKNNVATIQEQNEEQDSDFTDESLRSMRSEQKLKEPKQRQNEPQSALLNPNLFVKKQSSIQYTEKEVDDIMADRNILKNNAIKVNDQMTLSKLIRLQKEKEQVIDPEAQNKFLSAMSKLVGKKQEEYNSQEQYFNQVLKEAKQNIQNKDQEVNKHTNLRTLVQQKLSLRLSKNNSKVTKSLKEINIQHRASKNKLYANTVDLSLDRYPLDLHESDVMDAVNTLFSFLFVAEMIIKIIGLSLKYYLQDPFNIFDCVVVVSSMVDFLVSQTVNTTSNGAITALRAFRLIRIFKLAKSWKKFQNLLKTMIRTLKDVSTFSILLFLFMFIYSLLALEIFANRIKFNKDGVYDLENGHSTNTNFDNLINSFTTVFIILTNDGWAAIFYDCYRTVGSTVSILFFISLIIFGQKIMLNLFLAILLENFDEESLNQDIKDKLESYKDKDEQKLTRWQFIVQKSELCWNKCRKRQNKQKLDESLAFTMRSFKNSSTNLFQAKAQDESMQSSKNLLEQSQNGMSPIKRRKQNQFLNTNSIENGPVGISLNIFTQQNRLRQFIFKLVTNTKFDIFIIIVIIVSGVQLAMERPLNDPNSQYQQSLVILDILTTIIFCLECVLKIVAFGLLRNGPQSYMRNSWNLVDFSIIIFSIISLTPLSSSFKTFKMLRVVRGIKLVSKNEGLKLAVKALVQAIPQIANVSIIMLLFFLIFGIIAVNFFKGKFYYCEMESVLPDLQYSVLNKWSCLDAGGIWKNKPWSFDNILEAMKSLFQMSTTSGWSDIMYFSIQSTEIDNIQRFEYNMYWIVYFIVFIIVGSFFMLNLFVGVVISTFNREKDNIGGNNLLTDSQKQWIDTMIITFKAKPIKVHNKPPNRFRKFFFSLQERNWFNQFIFICILLNTFVLMLKYYNQPQQISQATDILNYVFTLIFTMEAVIKIIALDKGYFEDNWNIFDFVVVIGSILSVLITAFSSVKLGGATTIIRAFRITRVFRIVKRARTLKIVFNAFIFTIPALANVGGLLLLLLYLYSIVGVILFGDVMRNGLLTDNLNYETFPNAFITLFSISTGDAWDQVMAATIRSRSIDYQCIENPSYMDYVKNNYIPIGCGQGPVGYIFYYSYILLVNLIFLNLFIAIILQGYEDTQQKESKLFNQECLDNFRNAWSKFDPTATTFIKISQLKEFLLELGKPLGWDEKMRERTYQQDKFVANLDLPIYNNFSDYMFLDVLEGLALRLVVLDQLQRENDKIKKEELEYQDLVGEDQIDANTIKQKQKEMKQKIEHDINKLKFQEEAKNIQAVKEVQKIQQRRKTILIQSDQVSQLTSVHQAAALESVKHMKFIVQKRKMLRKPASPQIADNENQVNPIMNKEFTFTMKNDQNRKLSGLFLLKHDTQTQKVNQNDVEEPRNQDMRLSSFDADKNYDINSMKSSSMSLNQSDLEVNQKQIDNLALNNVSNQPSKYNLIDRTDHVDPLQNNFNDPVQPSPRNDSGTQYQPNQRIPTDKVNEIIEREFDDQLYFDQNTGKAVIEEDNLDTDRLKRITEQPQLEQTSSGNILLNVNTQQLQESQVVASPSLRNQNDLGLIDDISLAVTQPLAKLRASIGGTGEYIESQDSFHAIEIRRNFQEQIQVISLQQNTERNNHNNISNTLIGNQNI